MNFDFLICLLLQFQDVKLMQLVIDLVTRKWFGLSGWSFLIDKPEQKKENI